MSRPQPLSGWVVIPRKTGNSGSGRKGCGHQAANGTPMWWWLSLTACCCHPRKPGSPKVALCRVGQALQGDKLTTSSQDSWDFTLSPQMAPLSLWRTWFLCLSDSGGNCSFQNLLWRRGRASPGMGIDPGVWTGEGPACSPVAVLLALDHRPWWAGEDEKPAAPGCHHPIFQAPQASFLWLWEGAGCPNYLASLLDRAWASWGLGFLSVWFTVESRKRRRVFGTHSRGTINILWMNIDKN